MWKQKCEKKHGCAEIRIVAKVGIIRLTSPDVHVNQPRKDDARERSGEKLILPIGLGHTFELVLFLYLQKDQFNDRR